MRTKINRIVLFLVFIIPALSLRAQEGDFKPDPLAVVRFGAGYRYPQAGWLVLHIEGEPYERGVQHGRLLASEIAAHIRSFAALYSPKAPPDAWKLIRLLTQSLFLNRFEREYLEEMRGIADGAAAANATFHGRPLDLTDIAALNLWPEIMCLEWGAAAVPTGLEGIRFPTSSTQQVLPPKPGHCSAFAATGPATSDGKIVFGHITMFELYPSTFYNIWLDVKPSQGHRVLMQSFPGGIHSAMDYYINDAGILVSETTINQTRFNALGSPLAGRIRRALQYSDSIDEVVATLEKENNGLYTNEWLLADTKTNEIAMFELGTHVSRLYRSSKGEWFGGTEGFYWGCNNAKDLNVRLETFAATNDRPENVVWHPSDRDVKWMELYRKHKGRIGVEFGKEAFTTPPLCAAASVDAKFTTTKLANDLRSWAIFGPPREQIWEPSDEEKRKYPEIEPLVPNPWTILHGMPPGEKEPGVAAADLALDVVNAWKPIDREDPRKPPGLLPKVVWRGTLLPKTDGDIWLASAFAEYHRIVEREKGIIEVGKRACPCAADLDKLSLNLYGAKSRYLAAVAAVGDTPLSRIKSREQDGEWYRIAAGKGVLVLNELRRRIGDDDFLEGMDSFGFENAGKAVAWQDFASHMSRASGENLDDFFEFWVNGTGLPKLRLLRAEVVGCDESAKNDKQQSLEGAIAAESGPLPAHIVVTVETDGEESTKVVAVDPQSGAFRVDTEGVPRRLIVDKYAQVASANGGVFSLGTWYGEQEQTLIVYGTADDEAANREAAELFQEKARNQHSNFTIPIRSDANLTASEWSEHHLIIIGRPTTNRIADRFRAALPVEFGAQSFTVRGKSYAHPRSAVIAAGANPTNPRFSVVVIAGLSATATYLAAERLLTEGMGAEVLLLAHGEEPQPVVVPAPELTRTLSSPTALSNGKGN